MVSAERRHLLVDLQQKGRVRLPLLADLEEAVVNLLAGNCDLAGRLREGHRELRRLVRRDGALCRKHVLVEHRGPVRDLLPRVTGALCDGAKGDGASSAAWHASRARRRAWHHPVDRQQRAGRGGPPLWIKQVREVDVVVEGLQWVLALAEVLLRPLDPVGVREHLRDRQRRGRHARDADVRAVHQAALEDLVKVLMEVVNRQPHVPLRAPAGVGLQQLRVQVPRHGGLEAHVGVLPVHAAQLHEALPLEVHRPVHRVVGVGVEGHAVGHGGVEVHAADPEAVPLHLVEVHEQAVGGDVARGEAASHAAGQVHQGLLDPPAAADGLPAAGVLVAVLEARGARLRVGLLDYGGPQDLRELLVAAAQRERLVVALRHEVVDLHAQPHAVLEEAHAVHGLGTVVRKEEPPDQRRPQGDRVQGLHEVRVAQPALPDPPHADAIDAAVAVGEAALGDREHAALVVGEGGVGGEAVPGRLLRFLEVRRGVRDSALEARLRADEVHQLERLVLPALVVHDHPLAHLPRLVHSEVAATAPTCGVVDVHVLGIANHPGLAGRAVPQPLVRVVLVVRRPAVQLLEQPLPIVAANERVLAVDHVAVVALGAPDDHHRLPGGVAEFLRAVALPVVRREGEYLLSQEVVGEDLRVVGPPPRLDAPGLLEQVDDVADEVEAPHGHVLDLQPPALRPVPAPLHVGTVSRARVEDGLEEAVWAVPHVMVAAEQLLAVWAVSADTFHVDEGPVAPIFAFQQVVHGVGLEVRLGPHAVAQRRVRRVVAESLGLEEAHDLLELLILQLTRRDAQNRALLALVELHPHGLHLLVLLDLRGVVTLADQVAVLHDVPPGALLAERLLAHQRSDQILDIVAPAPGPALRVGELPDILHDEHQELVREPVHLAV
mmetsp:Transcript_71550/g.186493  ORF Transcript_71550/g.186493 Transcript_71550/m.186493 type:complete len:890 (+) Transcript_71550:428-3097(+)